jgi:hypothetical protein
MTLPANLTLAKDSLPYWVSIGCNAKNIMGRRTMTDSQPIQS